MIIETLYFFFIVFIVVGIFFIGLFLLACLGNFFKALKWYKIIPLKNFFKQWMEMNKEMLNKHNSNKDK